jgi:hypothetical protein
MHDFLSMQGVDSRGYARANDSLTGVGVIALPGLQAKSGG